MILHSEEAALTKTLNDQARLNKLPAKGLKVLGAVSAWTATLLFMWAPVAQAVSAHLVQMLAAETLQTR